MKKGARKTLLKISEKVADLTSDERERRMIAALNITAQAICEESKAPIEFEKARKAVLLWAKGQKNFSAEPAEKFLTKRIISDDKEDYYKINSHYDKTEGNA